MKKISEMPEEMHELFKTIKHYVDETDYPIGYVMVNQPEEFTEPLTVELFILTNTIILGPKNSVFSPNSGDKFEFDLGVVTQEKLDILKEAFQWEKINDFTIKFPNLEHIEE